MKASRAAALLVGLTAALTVAACGVPPSGVIRAGDPASGMVSPAPTARMSTDVSLYFLHNGDPTPYARRVVGPPDVQTAVGMLFAGPTASEARTASTELPRLKAAPKVRIDDGDTVVVQLPDGIPPLSGPAMRELECTVANAPGAVLPPVTVAGAATASVAVPAKPQSSSSVHMSIQVDGVGWTLTKSDGACPDPVQP